MGIETDWIDRSAAELARGRRARDEGNEGMARVCARRAAGILVRAYFEAKGVQAVGTSVLNQLKVLRDSPDEPDHLRETAGRFLLQITPEHVLPGGVDLISEAERLRSALFPEPDAGS